MTEMIELFRETGRQGGKIGGKKRAENLTAKQLSEIGKKGATARWAKVKKAKAAKAAKGGK
jgi:hypothetical protein